MQLSITTSHFLHVKVKNKKHNVTINGGEDNNDCLNENFTKKNINIKIYCSSYIPTIHTHILFV